MKSFESEEYWKFCWWPIWSESDSEIATYPECEFETREDNTHQWTKISSLETTIFYLRMMVKRGLDFYFEIHRAPSELLLPSAKIFAQNGRIGPAA